MRIINCWSITSDRGNLNAGDIVLITKDNNKRKIEIIKNFEWYFYVNKDEKTLSYVEKLHNENKIEKFKVGKIYIRIYQSKKYYKDANIQELILDLHSKGIETFEADIGPAKRYLLDQDFEIEDFDNINLYYFDIETDDSKGDLEFETNGDFTSVKAKDRILSVAFIGRDKKKYFIYDEDEVILLNKVNKFLKEKEVDMLVGWNSSGFDIPYLWKRMDKHNISSNYLKNILHEDLQKRVQYFYSKDPEARQNITSYHLNNIANYFINEGKIERNEKVYDLMKRDFLTFKKYNIQDAELLRKLEEKLGLIRLTYQMFQICHCTAQNWSMVKAIDNLILYEANKHKIHYPTNKSYYEKQTQIEPYLGALVLSPIPGYYENIYVLDFKSLYPNIIRTFNISPDTLLNKKMDNCIETPGTKTENGIKGKIFLEQNDGIIPKKIKLLLDERGKIREKQKEYTKNTREWKDLNVKQLVVKEIANSIYGVLGNVYFRAFNIDLAEAITSSGQYLILYVKNELEKDGHSVIYGDTDSVFLKIKGDKKIDDIVTEINEKIAIHLKNKFNVKTSSIEISLDKYFSKFIIETKKKYAGEIDGNLKMVGMECIKRDTIQIAIRLQRELISLIFNNKEIESWLISKKEEFLNNEVPAEDILIHKKLAKDAHLYKAKTDNKKYTAPIHVRIAQKIKTKQSKTNLSKGGSIISYIVTGTSPLIEGVHISEYKGKYDIIYYWNNIIFPILERLLNVSHPTIDWKKYYIYEKKEKKSKQKDTG